MNDVLHFQSNGETGNIFSILGNVRCIMARQRRITEYNYMWTAVQNSGSYEAALEIIGKHVQLVDDSTGKKYGKERAQCTET